MRTRENLLTGMAIGGGLMFLLDPQGGRRRRALTRDTANKWSRSAERSMRASWRQAVGAGRGVTAMVRRARHGERNDDEAVAQRLRQCIGRHSTHPRAIEVSVAGGVAKLSGHVLASELDEVLRCGSAISGVRAVENALQAHAHPGSVPELQGRPHARPLSRWWEKSPALRVGTGAAAAGVVAILAARRLVHD